MLTKKPPRATFPTPLAEELAAIVGPQGVIHAPEDLLTYDCDGYTITKGTPSLVVLPRTREQVASVVRLLAGRKQPFVARGAGTGLSGGSVPLGDAVIVCLTRMNRILEIDPLNRRAVVEPGVPNLRLSDETAPYGFNYAPDPSSQAVCTIGGNVAENTSGPHTLKYGVSSNHILGLEMVLPSGQVITLGGKHEDPAGYDLRGVVIGSEGTFGIVTEAIVRLTPLPDSARTMLAAFDTLDQSSETVTAIIAAGIIPAALEMIDKTFIRPVEEAFHFGFPLDAEAVLIIELDDPEAGLDALATRVAEICQQHGVRDVRLARNQEERDLLWKSRKMAVPAAGRYYPTSVTQDGVVPRSRLPEVLREIRRIGEQYGIAIGNVFHAGDGNLHPVVLFDDRDPDQLARMRQASEAILRHCVLLGGSITGEHGVGVEKMRHMRLQFSEAELDLMRRIRSVFDPEGLANPGKVVPEPQPPGDKPQEASAPTPAGNAEDRLRQELGEDAVAQGDPSLALDGVAPRWRVSPKTEEQVCAVLRAAAEHGLGVVPIAGGTDLHVGYAPRRYDIALCLDRMPATVDVQAADMSVRVGAGVTLHQLQQALAAHGQFLPLLVPHAERATVGGIVASGRSGPLRFGYRGVRDLLLGIKVALPNGEMARNGGAIVKNVAGYDFGKLYLGSRGSLGVVLEATFRTYPLPEHSSTLVAAFPQEAQAQRAFEALMTSRLPLSMLDLLDPHALAATPALPSISNAWALVIGAEGAQVVAAWVVMRAREICVRSGAATVARLVGQTSARARTLTAEVSDHPDALLSTRASTSAAATFAVIAKARELARDLGLRCLACAHAGNGIAHVHFLPGAAPPAQDALLALCEDFSKGVSSLQGSVTWERVPSGLKARLDLWAPLGNDFALMRRLKETLDPRGIMSPGRYLGRL